MGRCIARCRRFREPPWKRYIPHPAATLDWYVDESLRRGVVRLVVGFDSYDIEPFGISRDVLIKAYSPAAWLYRNYLRVSTFGM